MCQVMSLDINLTFLFYFGKQPKVSLSQASIFLLKYLGKNNYLETLSANKMY